MSNEFMSLLKSSAEIRSRAYLFRMCRQQTMHQAINIASGAIQVLLFDSSHPDH